MDKVILKQAVVDVIEGNFPCVGGLTRQWRLYVDDFESIGLEHAEELPFEREAFASKIVQRYFELIRIELAKDGN